MKIIIVLLIMSFIFPVASFAQHQFAFDEPKSLVKASMYPGNPDMVWDGKRFAIVYDDFDNPRNKSSSVFLMFADTDGNILEGPTKISKLKYAKQGKIVWTGTEYGVVLAEGKRIAYTTKFYYYLVRFNKSGKEIAREKLPGTGGHEYYTTFTSIFWAGNQYAIFYSAKPDGSFDTFPLYYRTKGTGKTGPIIKIFDYPNANSDIIWDGKRFVVLTSYVPLTYSSKAAAQLFMFDTGGNVISSRSVLEFAEYDTPFGVALIPGDKKDSYIVLCAGGDFWHIFVWGSRTNTAFFSGRVNLKNNSVGKFKLKKIASSSGADWMFPANVSVGKRRFIVGSHTDGITVVELSGKGKIVGKPLKYTDPARGAGLNPLPVAAGKKIGIIWAWDGLFLHMVDTK